MATASAAHGLFGLTQPRYLWQALEAEPAERQDYELLARFMGLRDLVVGALGMAGRKPRVVRTAMTIRIVIDLADCALLVTRTRVPRVRLQVALVTLSWAAMHAVALVIDRRRSPA